MIFAGDGIYQLRIRDFKEDRALTQTQIAQRLPVHQATCSDYELGLLNVPIAVPYRLADFFGVSVDYLLDRTAVKAPYPRNA